MTRDEMIENSQRKLDLALALQLRHQKSRGNALRAIGRALKHKEKMAAEFALHQADRRLTLVQKKIAREYTFMRWLQRKSS